MPPMPFYLEKGPMFSVIEDYVNADADRAVDTLDTLRIEDATDPGYEELCDLPAFSSTNLGAKPGDPYWVDFRNKWLGKGPSGDAGMMWSNYVGDVDLITRRTMRIALEIALGVDEGAPTVRPPARHWPIDLFWKCGQNWFEGWVTYRRLGTAGDGHVVVVFATPSEGSTIVDRPADSSLLIGGPDYEVGPTSTRDADGNEREAGMRVVTHRHNDATPSFQLEVTPVDATFQVVINPAHYVGREEVVVVRPGEADGGVLAQPRPYLAP